MNRFASLAAVLISLAVSACSSGPGETWSLRQSLADAIAPPGYQPNGGPAPAVDPAAQAQAQAVQGAYQSDVARMQAGAPAVMVSQVTIYGGRINVPTGGGFGSADWRDAGGVATATVAECESAPIRLQRADKPGAGVTVFATRINGIVYVSPWAATNCQPPASAQSYPGRGRFPLAVQGRVMGATVQIDAWGGSAPAYPYPYYPQ